jgi:hypothetical protein
LNKGRPITLDNHNELSASFRTFARALAGIAAKRTSDPPTGFLGRLTGRRSPQGKQERKS